MARGNGDLGEDIAFDPFVRVRNTMNAERQWGRASSALAPQGSKPRQEHGEYL